MEASTPAGSGTDEETDEDSEPEPPPVVRRKVSFADAFGLNLVSVKEFDHVEVAESEASRSDGRDVIPVVEDFYMSCLFTVPSSSEELEDRLQAQMVELESIELLPGTTTIRGIVRVVNLCFSKCVYVRLTLDHWKSHFDLLAEYVPGSSDRKTDRFTFRYTMVPPFERDGARVEFCLRYETSVGTFWANNKQMNYVLFCHQRAHMKEPQLQEEISIHKGKRSCLKANRNGSASEMTWETILSEKYAGGGTHKPGKGGRKTVSSAGVPSLLHRKEDKSLVESVKSRHKATRLAHVQDYLSQRRLQAPAASPHVSGNGQKSSQPLPLPWGGPASFLDKCQTAPPNESPQVLTYHQIPLLTLDWNNDKPQQWGAADVDDIWTGKAQMTLSKASEENTPSVLFHNGADDSADRETSVCDVWQTFLNGPSCEDHSAIPESEWLQTATSMSPSNDKEPHTKYAASSQDFPEFREETPTALHGHTSAACQRLSDSCETLLANLALNAEDHRPDDPSVSGPRHDNTATQAASQRSQTNSETDTPQEFSLEGPTPVSEHSVDCSAECHAEPEREGIIGGAEGIGGDEPFTSHIADLVTSSGESQTTDMTAMPESQNASAVDRISQGARLHGGLSSSGKGEATGTAHNAVDDTLAFRETIRQGTKDGASSVVSTSRQGVEEGVVTNSEENKVRKEEETFKAQGEREISLRYADEAHCEECGLSPNTENPLKENERNEHEIRSAQSNTGGFEPYQICEKNLNENYFKATKVNEHESSNIQDIEETEEETSDSTTRKQEESLMSGDVEMIQAIDQEINPSVQIIPTMLSWEMRNVSQKADNACRHYPTDEPKPLEVIDPGWTRAQEEMRGQKEDVGREINLEDFTAKSAERKDTSTEHQPEKPDRTDKDKSRRDERVSIGKLKTDAMRELMGNVEGSRGKRKNAPAELKEQELSAEVESSPLVEYKRLSGGTKDTITAENTTSLEVIGQGLEEMFIERFAEDLIWGIMEEVFSLELPSLNRDVNVDRMSCRPTDTTPNCHLFVGKDDDDTFDSGVFSLVEFLQESNVSLCQDPEQKMRSPGIESSHEGGSQSLTAAGQTHVLSKLQSDFNSSDDPSQNLTSASAPHSWQVLKNQENDPQTRERSLPRQEAGRQTDVNLKETFSSSVHQSHWSSSPEKIRESSWWMILYIISHITRLLICILLVGGFFVVVFLYDFPAFFGLYIFSLCWWFYKWRRYRVTTKQRMVG
uniref:CBM21 domain-containing protein n=2 Tax=Salarias fasciatus TaxID=181472 RepID=A0A672JBI6_SALFA